MSMKKIFALIPVLILSAAILLSGCGSTPSASSGSGSGSGDGTPADIKAVKDRGVIKVGVKVDVPKFGFKDPATGKVDGMEIDIARAIAKKILGDETKIEVQPVTAKTRGPLLDNGEVDYVIATFTVTDERKKSYNFSEPYFQDGVALMVKKSSGITDLAGLNGKKIGVAQSATSKQALLDEAKKDNLKLEFLEFGTYPEIKTALDSGRIDCFSVDGAILAGYLDDSTVILPARYSPQLYGIASKKGNDALTKAANNTIAEMKASGEMDKVLDKWGLK